MLKSVVNTCFYVSKSVTLQRIYVSKSVIVMERIVLKQLIEWKNSADRKPLILNGARQVGKTWLLQELARKEYKKQAYIVCRKNELVRQVFAQDFDNLNICCFENNSFISIYKFNFNNSNTIFIILIFLIH